MSLSQCALSCFLAILLKISGLVWNAYVYVLVYVCGIEFAVVDNASVWSVLK